MSVVDEGEQPVAVDEEDEVLVEDTLPAENVDSAVELESADAPWPPQCNERLRKVLEHQHYSIVGHHSAVKVCNWTRKMLEGRGTCYKHKFYGIRSHRCLQMTTSLACKNRCIFCWRAPSTPVGVTWRWSADEPGTIVDAAFAAHSRLIKTMRGIPCILERPELHAEAMQPPVHCALSLVGEAVMYPRVNEVLQLLHARHVSTFVVSNAQCPQELRQLVPVTQLYLSIDAPTPELLKRIDRPLHADFWDRMNECLDILARKQQRTAIRLTAIKGVNMIMPELYASLILRGDPDFVEIKGYTYAGKAKLDRGELTMEANVPYHREVLAFAVEVARCLSREYAFVTDHPSSCVVLLAKRCLYTLPVDDAHPPSALGERDEPGECERFCRTWRTWIDFEAFDRLAAAAANGASGSGAFTTADYLRAPDAAELQHPYEPRTAQALYR